MGLDDLIEDKTGRSITSRKDPSNASIPEGAWKEIAAVYPDAVYIAASRADKNDARCLVSLLDDILEDGEEGVPGWTLNQDQLEHIETARDDIVEAKNL